MDHKWTLYSPGILVLLIETLFFSLEHKTSFWQSGPYVRST